MLSTHTFKEQAPYFILVRQLALLGFCIAFFHGILAFYWSQHHLLIFSSVHVIACAIVYIISKSLPTLSVHVLISSYIISFAVAPFYGVFYLSTMLIYPLMLALVIFFLDDVLERYVYAVLSITACTILLWKIKTEHFQGLELDLLQECIMIAGQLIALVFIGHKYLSIVYGYQKQLEKKDVLMQKKNKDLSKYIASNLQLENFAHLASHELKAPLKNIQSFSKLLSVNLADTATARDKKMLFIIESQASEMDQLIKDLYELSSATNEPMKVSIIELKLLVTNLIKFEFAENAENIRVKYLPQEITGNKTYIKEIFKNLISNALKFKVKGIKPQIIIDCETNQNIHEFSVIDNGIGISENKREKIFLIFKRLHNKEDYEGTGIGLSLCKKIVERHEGDIWMEDNPSGGSIFKFTIPNIQSNPG